MRITKIDLYPPKPTGNPNTDIVNLTEHIVKLTEKLNYILTIIEKELNNG